MIKTISGGCVHIEIDAEDGLTHATFVFKTPNCAETLGGFVAMLSKGIEVLVPLDEESDDDEDDED